MSLRRQLPLLTLGSLAGLLVFGFFVPASQAATYTEPTAIPRIIPTNPLYQFLNGSAQDQQKTGSLMIGTSAAEQLANGWKSGQLCLNGTTALNQGDNTGCITAWSQVAPTGNFLHVNTLPTGTDGAVIGNYQGQTGSINVMGINTLRTHQNVSGIFFSSTLAANAKAIDARSLSSSSYAGYLLGATYIYGINGVKSQLCLNGANIWDPFNPATGHCLRTWADLIPNQVTGYLKVQSGNYPTPDAGIISVSDSTMLGSMTTGDPSKLAAQFSSFTCGDGWCSAGETTGSCPVDCSSLIAPTGLIATAGRSKVSGQINYTASVSSPAHLLLIRQPQGSPTFQPFDGSLYDQGAVINSVTVVVATTTPKTSSGSLPFTDSGLTPGRTYTYTAWQGNHYPRYGQPLIRNATPTP